MNRTARIAATTFAVAALAGVAGCSSDKDSSTATGTTTPASPSVQVRPVVPATAAAFTVTADTTAAFPADFYAGAFGCTAANRAPHLQWSGAPAAAQSFAVTMFDPDAPTGAGFWHWMNWDIPATATDFTAGAAGVAGTNDAGIPGYLGPCPPTGDKPHTYKISILALDTPSLGLPATTTPTVASFSMGAHIIGTAELTLTAQR
ncbi:YbhB/YbcL family Raf kinase inhibitor-like protein [Nocardia seriolae]|nr:YbhB/YbcL family Raf kinase inhibitor-like protein [Nocardia seriolae]MTJ60357.1 YbhB/YbcL family Raf kinase inhibitor-like protein [Nocardia seriolae]MTJ74483.1 YbhB/YbcL family Raf kinase inhibitor-like protein [Nocardia seriolae]MTJ84805.1 YbhB/YbcL family Raf kinase inhibitor-like protein [Nocardia seriolae]MTK28794.1 YbhB/YbcL family Raf kinase inhibitor-like protein [Nocardia seriolae]MTK38286.1 YbhB/YbcL family Raf kinase inhibitor-like protein [Nocardia seriolae]